VPHTVAFPTRYARELLPEDLWVDEDDPVDSVVRVLAWGPGNQWRHSAGSAPPAARRRRRIRTRRPGPRNSGERVEREFLAAQQPSVPSLSDHQVRRWTLEVSWAPAEALLLCRHKHIDGERRVYTHDRDPPRGHRLEFSSAPCTASRYRARPSSIKVAARASPAFRTPAAGSRQCPDRAAPEPLAS
jgi:hypothetical protein